LEIGGSALDKIVSRQFIGVEGIKLISRLKSFVKKYLPFSVPMLKATAASIKHLQSQKKLRRLLMERNEIFVELGSGDRAGQGGWITIDMTKHCDIFWDLRKGLPFSNDSVAKIYSSHFFEHLSFKEAQDFLIECKRVLAPGGKFLICIPNAKIYLEAYVTGKNLPFDEYFLYKPAYNHTTRIDYVNYMAYMNGEHKYMFDEENILYILKSKGFNNVRLRKFDPNLDMKERDYESIYAEAQK
jgi:predicted SAM-dependent methyltransferase